MVYVYILQNPEGRFYVGQTQDLAVRLSSHNADGPCEGKFTRKNGPWTLVYHEAHPTRSLAMQRERLIKGWKSAARIRDLISSRQSPASRD
jgi:putative endonuclease